MYSEQRFYVRAISQKRCAEWDRIFGTDELPVRRSRPSPTPAGCLAYRLDESRLHWMQRERLITHLVRKERMAWSEARKLVVEGLPIPAHDAALVQEQDTPAPFLLRLLNVLCGKMLLATHNV